MPRKNITRNEKLLKINKNKAAKALAHFMFREIIEDAHSHYKISQEDMKKMNRQAVNRAALFLEFIEDKTELAAFVNLMNILLSGEKWDNPTETKEIKKYREIVKETAEKINNSNKEEVSHS